MRSGTLVEGSRLGTAWGLVAALVTSLTIGFAGEPPKSKIVFSDSKTGPMLPEAALHSLPGGLPGAGWFQDGGSLGSVAAPPFAAPMPAPILTYSPRERDRQQSRNDWVLRSVQGLGLSEASIDKAFGVRHYNLAEPSSLATKRNSSWSAFMGGADDRAAPGKNGGKDEMTWRNMSPAAKGEKPLYSTVNSAEGRGDRAVAGEPNTVVFSDRDLGDRRGSNVFDVEREAGREMDRDPTAPLNGPGGASPRWSGLNHDDAQTHAEEFRKMLGFEPTVSRNMAVRPLLGGSADAINLQPDLTRQELNPVVSRPIPTPAAMQLPGSAGPAGPVAAILLRQSSLDALSSRAFAPAATESAPALSLKDRKRAFSPTVLPVPGRSF